MSLYLRKEKFGSLLFDVENNDISVQNQLQTFVLEQSNMLGLIKLERVIDYESSNNRLSGPVSVCIFPSVKCNKSCEFCFTLPFRNLYNTDMSYGEFVSVVNKVHDIGVFDIEIMGGEPFLIPWILEGINYVVGKNIRCSINTNGLLVTDKDIDALSIINHLDFRISIYEKDGLIDEHVLNILEYCAKIRFRVICIIVIESLKSLDIYHSILSNINPDSVKHIVILEEAPVYGKINNNFKNRRRTSDILKCIPDNLRSKVFIKGFADDLVGQCSAAAKRIEIMPDGNVVPCSRYYFYEKNIGNIFNDNVKSLWETEKMLEYYQKLHLGMGKLDFSKKNINSYCIGYWESLLNSES